MIGYKLESALVKCLDALTKYLEVKAENEKQ